ncbi:MAG: aminoacyl-histidine dipeptidase [Agathobacter sp.]|nr:aminoacyl-histidine dipeptidase [Agathobacter sp.]
MRVLENLQPERVFYYFEEIAKIPHGSGNTKQISDYLVEFAKEHNLEHYQDEVNNVIMIKEATTGYEYSDSIIIQGHMDMVCEKESDYNIDFEKDGLELFVEDGFVKARGTTLGGDDGIAVAYALALLESSEYAHPRLEVVITIDEETGMDGAYAIDLSMLKGKKMLNIDSDEEGVFLTSCAGGTAVKALIPVKRNTEEGVVLNVKVDGLFGGHSGGEIHKERGNASILMGRVLNNIAKEVPFGIITLAGGLKDNAIPRECNASILVPEEGVERVEEIIATTSEVLKKEFFSSDAGVQVTSVNAGVQSADILDFVSLNKVLCYLRMVPNGVQNMSQAIPGLVETSLNLGIMELKEDVFMTETSIRSSVRSRKEDVRDRLINIIEVCGGEAEVMGDYPAWEYKAESKLRDEIAVAFKNVYGKDVKFDAIHAGLECGILSEKIEGLDCVSFGPQNFDIHTPQERLNIESTERVWKFLVEFLKQAK